MSRRAPLCAVVVALVLAAACGGGGSKSPAASGAPGASSTASGSVGVGSTGSSGTIVGRPLAEVKYGQPPKPTANVVFQPEVVLVGGGPSAVRSVSASGRDWTIDAGAANADKLAVGKIMFLTSKAVGRVTAIKPGGKNLTVTLARAGLTEIFKELHGTISHSLSGAGMSAAVIPNRRVGSVPTPAEASANGGTSSTTTTLSGGSPGSATSSPGRPGTTSPSGANTSGPAATTGVTKPPATLPKSGTQNPSNGGTAPDGNGVGSVGVCAEPTNPNASSDESNLTDPLFKPDGLDPGVEDTGGLPPPTIPGSLPPPKPPKNIPAPGTVDEEPAPIDTAVSSVLMNDAESGLTTTVTGDPHNITVVEDVDKGGLKLQLGWCLGVSGEAKIEGDVGITDGTIVGYVRVSGVDQLLTWVDGGSANGLDDNQRLAVSDYPLVLEIPAGVIEGIPLTIYMRLRTLYETAFSAKNSTLFGFGDYRLDGELLYQYVDGPGQQPVSELRIPTLTVAKPILNSLAGRSVGVNGVVSGMSMRWVIGVGDPEDPTGVFAKLSFGLGTTVGSDLGIVKCRGATLAVDASGGVTRAFDEAGLDRFGNPTAPVPDEKLIRFETKTVFDRTAVIPNVPVCNDSASPS